MFELTLRISARPKGITPMVQALAQVVFQARLQPGCVNCELYASTGSPRSLFYVEQWVTQDEMDGRLCSPQFGTLLAIMETASEAPRLEIRRIEEQRGLEYVEALRLGCHDHPAQQPAAGHSSEFSIRHAAGPEDWTRED